MAPFSIDPAGRPPLSRGILTLARPALERLLGLATLNELYDSIDHGDLSIPFARKALDALGIRYEAGIRDRRRIPVNEPLVVVANHPFGMADGLILLDLLEGVRPDVRFLGNFLLGRIPELGDRMLPVDPFGGPGAPLRNAAAARGAIRWVRRGGVIAAFPAGEVAHRGLLDDEVLDPAWGRGVGRLIARCRAAVLPVFFEGSNSAAFMLAGMAHPRLRTALIPRELLGLRGRTVQVRIGSPVPFDRLAGLDDCEITDLLRARTYLLRSRSRATRARSVPPEAPAAIAGPRPPAAVALEIQRLPEDRCLARTASMGVWWARAGEIPESLQEIGRLREIAFRGAGEGSGESIDLDRFDRTYIHLFVWNDERTEIVGAYRMGATDEILPREGIGGLYTSTLFRIRRRLLSQLGPTLELGRSFVRPEYQRETAPLALLWKGIASYVAARPRYRMLFGPVSISNAYDSMSRDLLMRFLEMNRYLSDLGRWVRPRNRYSPGRISGPLVNLTARGVEEVDALIREIEADGKGAPVLLRQYLRLDARLLGFNLDPEFGDVLDGLMLVDLTRVARPILDRFMGREAARAFLAFHGSRADQSDTGEAQRVR